MPREDLEVPVVVQDRDVLADGDRGDEAVDELAHGPSPVPTGPVKGGPPHAPSPIDGEVRRTSRFIAVRFQERETASLPPYLAKHPK